MTEEREFSWITMANAGFTVLRRLRCQKCKRMHIKLPDIFIPYKRYSAVVIVSVIEERTSGAPYEERTRQKICSWYRRVKSHLLAQLAL